MWESLFNLMILPSSQFCKRPYSEDDNTKGVIKKKTETILVLVRILWMAGCVWGMWVAMGSNWKLITKFGCFYHFALQRSARECTKFLNPCAVLLFCQLHLLFCHILVAIDVFGLHKLPNTNYFFKFVYVHNA